jgi:sulfide dehydrogenase cytochrome subunit
MQKTFKYALVAGALAVMGAGGANAASGQTGASAKMLAETCFGCHGNDGASNGPAIPTIAGFSTEYLTETMKAYASGDIKSTIMGRIAKGYSDDEIEAMSKFFAAKEFVAAPGQKFDAKLAKKGAKYHDKYCEKCHADGATSAEDDSGILAGQWTPYVKWSLEDYHNGNRTPPKKMKKKLKKLAKKKGDKGFEALLNFYASGK